MEKLCENVGVRKVFSSPYHPQTDDFIDLFNRTIMNDIRSLVSAAQSDWHEHLYISCFRYNTTLNVATKITPYNEVFGMEAFELLLREEGE